MQQTNDGGYVVAGTSESNDGDVTGNHGTNLNSDIWVVKLGAVTGIANTKDSFETINIYPNPASDLLYIDNILAKTTINIYDIRG